MQLRVSNERFDEVIWSKVIEGFKSCRLYGCKPEGKEWIRNCFCVLEEIYNQSRGLHIAF